MAQAMALAGHQMFQTRRGWRSLPFSPEAVLHARGVTHSKTDCPFCRAGLPICPAHPL